MHIPLLFAITQEGVTGLLAVYLSSVLARFADAVFTLNKQYVFENIWLLIGCISISVMIIPLFGYICNVIMLKHALIHDRLVIGRFLDKKYDKAIEIDKGEAQYRLENDPNDYRIGWLEWMTKLFVTPVILTFLLIYAFRVNFLFTLITFLLSLLKLIIPVSIRKINARYYRDTREYNTSVRIIETELTTQPHSVIMYGLKKAFLDKLDILYERFYKKTEKKQIHYQAISGHVSSIADMFFTLLVLFVGVVFVSTKTVSAGNVAAMIGYFGIFGTILDSVGYLVRERTILDHHVTRLEVLYSHLETSLGIEIDEFHRMSIHGLNFVYGDKAILSGLDCEIKTGMKTAITGLNGSGKTTLLKIICGLMHSYGGSVHINEIELADINMNQWRKLVSFAMQNPYLFHGSVADNITLGDDSLSEKAIEIMRELGIEILAEKVISAGGDELSGGEKQKISIARAIIKDTPLLLLDEPTNHIDSGTRDWLLDYIENTGRTVIFVSHDQALLEKADCTIQL